MMRGPVLVLAGTGEARCLVARLVRLLPGGSVIASLAGATRAPVPLACETRHGGFGGASGLACFIRQRRISLLIDAVHPFAVTMRAHAQSASGMAGCRLVRLHRPPWRARPGDIWHDVANEAAARDVLPSGARVFVALGRRAIARFCERADIWCAFRCIDPPPVRPDPARALVIESLPLAGEAEERALMTRLAVTHLVARNSGGTGGRAKIAAAASLALPVIMISRPPAPPSGLEPVWASQEEIIRLAQHMVCAHYKVPGIAAAINASQ